MDREQLNQHAARVVHAAHRELLSEWGYPVWDELPQWRRDLLTGMVGVARTGASARRVHGYWRDGMLAHGWEYAAEPDLAALRHPWLTSWEKLDQRGRGVYLTQQAIVATVTLEVYGEDGAGGRAMSAALGLVFRTALIQSRLAGRGA